VAERFRGLAADGADRPVGERMIGAALHYLGEQTQAREQIERMLGHQADPVRRAHAIRFQYDQQIAARMILARILWLQGFPDQARRAAEQSVADARRIDHALSICNALEIPCLVALWSGDAAAAERAVTALLDHSARHALTVRHLGARCFQGAMMIERGDPREGLDLLRTALDELRETSFVPYFPVTLGMLARGLARADLLTPALVTVEEALAKCERDEERWWIAELLRIKAEVVRRAEGPAARAVEETLHDALGWTHRQGSLSLELRCATDLARLWREQGRVEPARALLAPVVARFSEGLDGTDMRAASRLLEALG